MNKINKYDIFIDIIEIVDSKNKTEALAIIKEKYKNFNVFDICQFDKYNEFYRIDITLLEEKIQAENEIQAFLNVYEIYSNLPIKKITFDKII